ncbi:MAG: aspartate-semialdehyde dehydrogenase [Candidatus Peribacteraceae bacterium]|nr:aspartate-semialdehyde dehydrogenase [Candidatus Peribacteraceae bacterium]MDD5074402.1 aspartate-semialdehyde dehydrogenase [Candidatus Peribacteraceae bacterium]
MRYRPSSPPDGGRIPVTILGATGAVGQRFVERLARHPWFRIASLCASNRSAGNTYQQATDWIMDSPIPPNIAGMQVRECTPDVPGSIAFSALDSSVAGELEETFAENGYAVVSNARNHRMDPDVPLLIPEVNSDHLRIIRQQRYEAGCIITNPNCSTVGIVMALKPLLDKFGIELVDVTTLQAASGAGNPGVSSNRLIDNTIPTIDGETAKIETEPLKLLGEFRDGAIHPADMRISAQVNRVPVRDGHTANIKLKLRAHASPEDVRQALEAYESPLASLNLPSAPGRPLRTSRDPSFPQPYFHRNAGGGMAVSVGPVTPCNVLDYKFAVLSHNTVRGAAGAAILNAELLVRSKLLSLLRQ